MSWTDWLLVRRHHPLSTVSRRVGLGECWALSRCVRAYVCCCGAFLIAYPMLAHRTRVSLALFYFCD
jgi:hypothetical protein